MQALEFKAGLESWLQGEQETVQEPRQGSEEWEDRQDTGFIKRRFPLHENCEYLNLYNKTNPPSEQEAKKGDEAKPKEIENIWREMQNKWDFCERSLKILSYGVNRTAPAAIQIAGIVTSPKDITEQFNSLAKTWKKETRMHSALPAIVMHPAYLDIIGMGKAVIPFILRELKKSPDHWFTALRAIAKTSPIKPEDAGNLNKMRDAWLKWGKANGYLD